MSYITKFIVTGVISLLTLITLLIVLISVTFDTEIVRSAINDKAAQEGYQIKVSGDIEWRLFPQPGLVAKDLIWHEVSNTSGTIGQLLVTLDWEEIFGFLRNPRAISEKHDFWAIITGFYIRNGNLVWETNSTGSWQFNEIGIRASSLSFQGSPFPVHLRFKTAGDAVLETNLSLAIDQKIGVSKISNMEMSLGSTTMRGSVTMTRVNSSAVGELHLAKLDLKETLKKLQQQFPSIKPPQTSVKEALKNIGAKFEFDIEAAASANIFGEIIIDNQPFKFKARNIQSTQNTQISVSANHFAADNYLSSPDTVNEGVEKTLLATLSPIMVLPGQVQLELSLGTLLIGGSEIRNLYANLFSNGGVVRVSSLNADLFEGQLNASGRIDTRNNLATVDLQSSVSDVNIKNALHAFSGTTTLSGKINFDTRLDGRGNDKDTLLQSLTGAGRFNLSDVVYPDMNIEQIFCSANQLVTGNQSDQINWVTGTQLENVEGYFTLKTGGILFKNVVTSIGNLDISAEGTLDLSRKVYSINAITRLNYPTTSASGCIVSPHLKNRDIPLRCTGTQGQNKPPDCGIDMAEIGKTVKNNVIKEIGEKIFGSDSEHGKNIQDLIQKFLN